MDPTPPLCPSCGQPASTALAGPEHGWECRNEACPEFGQAVRADEPPAAAAPPGPARSGWTGGRILLVVLGTLAALLGAALLAAGGALLWVDQTQRDDDGFLSTPSERFAAPSYAVASEPIDLVEDEAGAGWLVEEDVLGDVRLRASGDGLFVGVGRAEDVDRYLDRVGHHRLVDVDYDPFRPRYEARSGGPPATRPADADVWVASASGSGEQVVTWDPEPGEWTAVVMNADASRGVSGDVAVGAEADALLLLAVILLVAGGVLLVAGVLMIVLGARRAARRRRRPPPAPADAVAP